MSDQYQPTAYYDWVNRTHGIHLVTGNYQLVPYDYYAGDELHLQNVVFRNSEYVTYDNTHVRFLNKSDIHVYDTSSLVIHDSGTLTMHTSSDPGARTFIVDEIGRVGIGMNHLGVHSNHPESPSFDLDVRGQVGIEDYIYHNDDTDTYMLFGTDTKAHHVNTDGSITPPITPPNQDYDEINFRVGGVDMLQMKEDGTQDQVVINKNQADVDTIIRTSTNTQAVVVSGDGSEIVINGDGNDDTDLRVVSDKSEKILFVDTSTDMITLSGPGAGDDTAIFDIQGNDDDDLTGASLFYVDPTETVLNKDANDHNFRVVAQGLDPQQDTTDTGTDGNVQNHTASKASHALFVDATNGRVGIGHDNPSTTLHVAGSAHIEGDLWVKGVTNQIDTLIHATSAMDITNIGTGPALTVTQSGAQPVAVFWDRDNNDVLQASLFLDDQTKMGIGTSSPAHAVHISDTVESQAGSDLVTMMIDHNYNHGGIGINSTAKDTQNHVRFLSGGDVMWQMRQPLHYTTDPDSLRFTHSSRSFDIITMIPNGDVGIGRQRGTINYGSAPQYRLQIAGDNGTQDIVQITTNDTAITTGEEQGLTFGQGDASFSKVAGFYQGGGVYGLKLYSCLETSRQTETRGNFRYNDLAGITLLGDNKTGINIEAPTAQLHVNGDFHVSVGDGTTDDMTYLPGTVSTTQDGNTVNGTGTSFSSHLLPGDQVYINLNTHTVTSIASDVTMSVTPTTETSNNGGYYRVTKKELIFADKLTTNVGIGTVSPSAKLEVKSPEVNEYAFKATRADGTVLGAIYQDNQSNGTIGIHRANAHTTIWLNSNGDSYFIGGNIGVGTTTPSVYDGEGNKFVIEDSGNTGLTISSLSDGSTQHRGNLYFADGTSGNNRYRGGLTYDHADDNLSLRTAATERMWIANNGNVGIGLDTPACSLDVNSTIRAISGTHVAPTSGTGMEMFATDSKGFLFNFNRDTGAYHDLQLGNSLYLPETTTPTKAGNVGINFSTPHTKLYIESTDGLRIPVGTTAQRPANAAFDITQATPTDAQYMPKIGTIRYNTTQSTFEGFGAGNQWGSLGGVIDVDRDTYWTAVNDLDNLHDLGGNKTGDDEFDPLTDYPGDVDYLRAFTQGFKRFAITDTGDTNWYYKTGGNGTTTPYTYDTALTVNPQSTGVELITPIAQKNFKIKTGNVADNSADQAGDIHIQTGLANNRAGGAPGNGGVGGDLYLRAGDGANGAGGNNNGGRGGNITLNSGTKGDKVGSGADGAEGKITLVSDGGVDIQADIISGLCVTGAPSVDRLGTHIGYNAKYSTIEMRGEDGSFIDFGPGDQFTGTGGDYVARIIQAGDAFQIINTNSSISLAAATEVAVSNTGLSVYGGNQNKGKIFGAHLGIDPAATANQHAYLELKAASGGYIDFGTSVHAINAESGSTDFGARINYTSSELVINNTGATTGNDGIRLGSTGKFEVVSDGFKTGSPNPRVSLISVDRTNSTTASRTNINTAPLWAIDNHQDTFRIFREPNRTTAGVSYFEVSSSSTKINNNLDVNNITTGEMHAVTIRGNNSSGNCVILSGDNTADDCKFMVRGIYDDQYSTHFDFVPDSGSEHGVAPVQTSPNVYTDATYASGTLRSSGDIIAFHSYSDRRLKKDITTLNGVDSLNKVLELQAVTYKWKDTPGQNKGTQIGLIAQDVEKIVPEVVSESTRIGDEQSYKRVDYDHIVPLLIESIKEQQTQIDELKHQVEQLSKQL